MRGLLIKHAVASHPQAHASFILFHDVQQQQKKRVSGSSSLTGSESQESDVANESFEGFVIFGTLTRRSVNFRGREAAELLNLANRTKAF